MPKSRFSAGLWALLVFLAGALAGGFGYRVYSLNASIPNAAHRRPTPEEWRRHYVAEMQSRVKLDAQQVTQLQQILDQTKDQFDQVRAHFRAEDQSVQNQQVEKIRAMLREDQRPLYEQLRAQHEAEREKRHKEEEKKR